MINHQRSLLLCALFMLAVVSHSAAGLPADPLNIVLHAEDFHTRQQAAARLDRNLDGDAIEALIALLEQHAIPELDSSEAVALKDIVCKALENQFVYPAQLPARLIAMFRDTRHVVAWRDYCIQHLNTACTKIPADERTPIYEIFREATAETDSTIAGTALIALTDHRSDPAITLEQLQDATVQIATHPGTSPASRLTALQIAAELGDTRVLPIARRLARDPSSERPLRLSAIAVIGTLGSPGDLPLLDQLSTLPGHVPGFAARTAARKLKSRYPDHD